MDAYRKAALTLHGLHDADKRWLLKNLPERHQEQLLLMLEELVELGIPRHPDLKQPISELEVEESTPETLPEEEEVVVPEPIRRLLTAPPEVLLHILNHEPPAVSAAVLLAHDWPWREVLLEAFSEPYRASVQGSMVRIEGGITEKASETILQILAEKCEHPPEGPPVIEGDASEPVKRTRRWFSFRRSKWQK